VKASTFFCLMAEYGTAQIPLELVAEKFWGMSPQVAKNRAAVHGLPVAAFRGSDSQKAGWFISASDLADYLDKQRAEAKAVWDKLN
jgi:hypothetical protein